MATSRGRGKRRQSGVLTEVNNEASSTGSGSSDAMTRVNDLTQRKLRMIEEAYREALAVDGEDEVIGDNEVGGGVVESGGIDVFGEVAPRKVVVLYEVPEGFQREEGVEYIDGMEDLLGDDVLETDYDIAVEDPPHLAFFSKVDDAEDKV